MHEATGKTCTIQWSTSLQPDSVQELAFTVRAGEYIWARQTLYSRDGQAESRPFVLPQQPVQIDIETASLSAAQAGTPLRLMSFNIYGGGTLDRNEVGAQNLRELIEYVSVQDPDVLFLVEAYGSGQQIVDGLNARRAGDAAYTGVQITKETGQAADRDNLWLISKLEVEKVYPRTSDKVLTSFNFGGARLRLPDGRHINAFTAWLYHADYAWGLNHQSAIESALGVKRTYTDRQVIATDEIRRVGMAKVLLQKQLPGYIENDDAPVFIGGDFNTQSHQDWTKQFAAAPGHGGLTLSWSTLKLFDEAGFIDTYRYANPDAGQYPGRTWSPISGFGYAPGRIDYILARGKGVRVVSSHTDVRRLERHQGTDLNRLFPFYSDHGAVISDVLIQGAGTGTTRTPTFDEPDNQNTAWPAPPAGKPVPPKELTASASTEKPGAGEASFAVDGNPQTMWHSMYPDIPPQPHEITVDMGRVRQLSAVRFQPKMVWNMNGTPLEGVVQVSEDGTTFQDVEHVIWARTSTPKDVDLHGIRARYLRLRVEYSMGGASSLAEITPYEE
ncbi:endonuclease/exonuclease/phosphatase family protein [Paenibacillus solanacearum]|uniref:endonuclease/exonuclease/phosphatase family protein n=1 Tax=Paenibacillus solanacearum TaxID=2048548 RepID=UPI001C405FAE|nr:endonuclease/exonuclease/phosphatase family protein [Paenibacillus solanacearum]